MDRKEVKRQRQCVCVCYGTSVWRRWVGDTRVCWGHRGEGTGGGGAIITGSSPQPPHPPELPDGTHSNPQWRKRHIHTYACWRTSIVSRTHTNTRAQALQKHWEEEPFEFGFNRLISHNSSALCTSNTSFPVAEVSAIFLQSSPQNVRLVIPSPHAVIETCHHMGAGTLRKCITLWRFCRSLS